VGEQGRLVIENPLHPLRAIVRTHRSSCHCARESVWDKVSVMHHLAEIIRPPAGTQHEPTSPPLAMSGVAVAYTAGNSGATARPNGRPSTGYALQDISFELTVGERIALVGPNGAGKSTLFKLIVGIIQPTAGSVSVFGRPPEKHTCIAYVPQRNEVDWAFPATVEDVVMMGRVGKIGLFRRPQPHDRALVWQSLERVQAQALAKKQIGELSGGQQQRVFIARALAQEAALLLLDEPLNGLDAPSQEGIFEVLDSVRGDGVTAVVATHDLDLAAERFDRIMLLNKRIVAFDQPDACLTADHLRQAYGAAK
jgi:manganese/iron transport system ATP-binding protein